MSHKADAGKHREYRGLEGEKFSVEHIDKVSQGDCCEYRIYEIYVIKKYAYYKDYEVHPAYLGYCLHILGLYHFKGEVAYDIELFVDILRRYFFCYLGAEETERGGE